MALFEGFRRKRDEPAPEASETGRDELDSEDESVDGPATWYRMMDLSIVLAGDDVLLHDPERATPMVLPTFELDLLAQCTHFAPVEVHADAAAQVVHDQRLLRLGEAELPGRARAHDR